MKGPDFLSRGRLSAIGFKMAQEKQRVQPSVASYYPTLSKNYGRVAHQPL
jgi:hypothetical protein